MLRNHYQIIFEGMHCFNKWIIGRGGEHQLAKHVSIDASDIKEFTCGVCRYTIIYLLLKEWKNPAQNKLVIFLPKETFYPLTS